MPPALLFVTSRFFRMWVSFCINVSKTGSVCGDSMLLIEFSYAPLSTADATIVSWLMTISLLSSCRFLLLRKLSSLEFAALSNLLTIFLWSSNWFIATVAYSKCAISRRAKLFRISSLRTAFPSKSPIILCSRNGESRFSRELLLVEFLE